MTKKKFIYNGTIFQGKDGEQEVEERRKGEKEVQEGA